MHWYTKAKINLSSYREELLLLCSYNINFYVIIEVRCTVEAFSFVLELLILKTKQMYF